MSDYYSHIEKLRRTHGISADQRYMPLWYEGLKFQGGPIQFKADMDSRIIEGHAARFSNRDSHGDVIVRGAFAKTIRERADGGLAFPVLRDHDPTRPVGKSVEILEDELGLFTRSKIVKTQLGDETLELAREGILTGMSIGFFPIKKEFGRIDGKGVRLLKELAVVEYSVLLFPANKKARITAVKSAESVLDFNAFPYRPRENNSKI